jgi:signal transduction histidine kinase
MASFPRQMGFTFIALVLLSAMSALYMGWNWIATVESEYTNLIGTIAHPHCPDLQRAMQIWQPKFRALSIGYFWAGMALIGFLLLMSCVFGWLLYRSLFKKLLTLRLQIYQTTKEINQDLPDSLSFREPVSDLQDDIQKLLQILSEQRQNEVFKEQVDRWQDVARRLAHEIRNPLTPILLTIQELEKQYRFEDPKFGKLLGISAAIIHEEIDALRRIVEEFSAFAKLPQAILQAQDLSQIAEEFLDTYNWFRGRVEILFDRHPQSLMVGLDRMLFRRVLHNLVENAIEVGSPLVILRTGILLISEEAICQIEDRGPGIPEHLQSKIFTPYFTTKQFGTGLGLSITKKIIIDHGGAISVSANPDGGSTFTIRLPLMHNLSKIDC